MKYKVIIGNQKYKVKDSGREYYFGENHYQEDIIHLMIDGDKQNFIINIEKPSSHTQYLLSQGRLGIILCKQLCNHKGHYHQSYVVEYIDGYQKRNKKGQVYFTKKQATRKKYYNRWSRINTIPIRLDKLTTTINIKDNILAEKFNFTLHDAPYYTAGSHIKIKAGLCTCGIRQINSAANRIYTMRSNIVTLKPIKKEFNCLEGYESSVLQVHYDNLDTIQHTCDIYIDGLGGRMNEMFNNGNLYVGIKVYGPTWGVGSRAWGTGYWNRRFLPNRASLIKNLEDYSLRDRGHKRYSSYMQVQDWNFIYTWNNTDIIPLHTLKGISNKHKEDIVINGTYSIVLFYRPTGKVLRHIVDKIPYTYIEEKE